MLCQHALGGALSGGALYHKEKKIVFSVGFCLVFFVRDKKAKTPCPLLCGTFSNCNGVPFRSEG